MSNANDDRTVIVGAGLAGLTLAERLAARGRPSLIIEREAGPGGLARSIEVGGLPCDLGPHRFHSDDPEVDGYIRDVLGDNLAEIRRDTSIFLRGRYHAWPIDSRALVSLPPRDIMHIAGDLLLRGRRRGGASFEEFIRNSYGNTLFDIFFRPMTEKFFRRPCSQIHPEWGTVSVDRAVIDPHGRIDSLGYLARRLLRPRPEFRFLYPRRGGIQAFADAQVVRLERSGLCEQRYGDGVRGLEIDRGRIAALSLESGATVPAGDVVWTAPIDRLYRAITGRPSSLSFIGTVFHFFGVDEPVPRHEQWIYLPDPSFVATRVNLQSNFYEQPRAWPTCICAEVTAVAGEPITADPGRFRDRVVDDLVRLGLVRDRARITAGHIVVVPETYPLYTVDYPMLLDGMLDEICGIENLLPLGRGAMFVYNNMDNSLKAALELDRWFDSPARDATPAGKTRWIREARKRC
jgi:protoporphyrinogen oxidase